MQINKHVHAIKIPFTITTPSGVIIDRFVYVYLIYGTNGVYLLDSGVASSEQALFSGDAIPVPSEMPVYEDVLASVASVRKLQAIKDVRYLLPSWDEPRQGVAVYPRMEEGLQYLQRIHDAVRTCSGKSAEPDLLEVTRCVLKEISLPPELANPIVARSIAAHLTLRDHKNIIG